MSVLDWNDPEMRLVKNDRRWVLPRWDPLGASLWYRSQEMGLQTEIGLSRVATLFRIGIDFEGVLIQGLVSFISRLPIGDPSLQYAYHEIIEEARHSMLFDLFLRKCETEVFSDADTQVAYARVARLGLEFPELFFLSVMAGESAFDLVQRRSLLGEDVHPLLAKINKLHCDDEARHLSFAKCVLRESVPQLRSRELRKLRFGAPLAVQSSADRMLGLPKTFVERWVIPDDVVRGVLESRESHELRSSCLRNVVDLCNELDLIDDRLRSMWNGLS